MVEIILSNELLIPEFARIDASFYNGCKGYEPMAQTLGTLLTASFLAVSAALPAATAQAGTNNFILHIPKSPEDVCHDIVNSGSDDHPPPQSLPSQPIKIVTADGRTIAIDAEIADTKAEQELGLMYRTELPEGHGMLFTDVKSGKGGQIGIWMKDTYIPLDILFLDAQGRVVKTVANAGACDMDVIWSGAPAASCLRALSRRWGCRRATW
jgi:uncharacterized membrane protein (UPF0127 family)